jgi:hypothetical protein
MTGSAPPSAAALALAGALFALYPAARPGGDATTAGAVEAFASPAWRAAHLSAVVAFVLLPLGLLAVRGVLARRAALVTWLGVGLTLPYYGAETLALHALGTRALRTGDGGLLALAEEIRMGPVQLTAFGVGLLLIAVGAVLAAVAVRRSGLLPRWSGVPLAAGMVLYLPQFYAPPGLRVAHGLLVAAGCLVLAAAAVRAGRR